MRPLLITNMGSWVSGPFGSRGNLRLDGTGGGGGGGGGAEPGGNYNVLMPFLTKVIRIGNSRGFRVPKALLEEAGLGDEVELRAEPGKLTASAVRPAREGWAEAAREMRAAGDDVLLDPFVANEFDEVEWQW